jgi:pentose-5-phosphate-3-epimerase
MIDGGIKHHNVALVKSWGIDVAVIGSGIINENGTVEENLKEISSAMKN